MKKKQEKKKLENNKNQRLGEKLQNSKEKRRKRYYTTFLFKINTIQKERLRKDAQQKSLNEYYDKTRVKLEPTKKKVEKLS